MVFLYPGYRAYSPRADLTQFGPGFGIREQLPERSSVPTELRAGVASLLTRRSYGSVPARGMPARDTSELAAQ